MIDTPDNQTVARLVQNLFPQSVLRRTRRLSGGISAIMVALELQHPDGQTQKLIVRSPAQADLAEKEFRLLQILQRQGGLKTPAPYLLDQSDGGASLIIEYIEGEMTFTPADLDNHLRQMATQLAHIHRLDLSQHDLAFLLQNSGACAELQRERPFATATFPQETSTRAFLTAAGLPESQNKTALLHGDFWPGNSLWQDGRLTAVIDWEDAMLGDPLIDLAQSRSEIVWIFGLEAMANFTSYYQQQVSLDYTALPHWDLCAALRQIRLLGDDLPGFVNYFLGYGRTDITPQSIRQNLNNFIAQAIEKISC